MESVRIEYHKLLPRVRSTFSWMTQVVPGRLHQVSRKLQSPATRLATKVESGSRTAGTTGHKCGAPHYVAEECAHATEKRAVADPVRERRVSEERSKARKVKREGEGPMKREEIVVAY